ncbi:MAG TPA: hypothetical protein VJ650_00565 [Gemmatimonadaceae bacterium]|nr:hypothetical protein [Gemmatimonadaceae bacterium]
MIESLIVSLRALAASPDVQLARFPDFVVKADELALDFADAHLIFAQCQQLEFTPAQRDAVNAVDRLLDEMSGPEHAALWSEQALREAPQWDAVRQVAKLALRELGYAEGPVPPSDATYIPGKPH